MTHSACILGGCAFGARVGRRAALVSDPRSGDRLCAALIWGFLFAGRVQVSPHHAPARHFQGTGLGPRAVAQDDQRFRACQDGVNPSQRAAIPASRAWARTARIASGSRADGLVPYRIGKSHVAAQARGVGGARRLRSGCVAIWGERGPGRGLLHQAMCRASGKRALRHKHPSPQVTA